MAILINTFTLGLETQHMVMCLLQDSRYVESNTYSKIDQFFGLLFIVEFAIRIMAVRWQFFQRDEVLYNCLDFILVSQSIFGSVHGGLQFERFFRLLRFARILRIIRVMRLFGSFRLMIFSIIVSGFALFSVFALLFFIMYLFTIFGMLGFVEYFNAHPDRHTLDVQTIEFITARFGTIERSMSTLFLTITGGQDWEDLMQPLLQISEAYRYFYYLYVFFMLFCVLNVITSLFVDSVYRVSSKDPDIIIEQELTKGKDYVADLKDFFEKADIDESGMLSQEEFHTHLQSTEVQAYFNHMELDPGQAETLFNLLDFAHHGEVGIDDLVEGCWRLKGPAKSLDIAVLQCKSEALSKFVQEQFQEIRELLGAKSSQRKASTFQMFGLADDVLFSNLGRGNIYLR